MGEFQFDMLVIGSGPAGQRAAIAAAKLGKRVAVIERRARIGGVCINTGTIPSKTLREAALYLSGYRLRSIYGASYTVKQDITIQDLLFRADRVIQNEIEVTRRQLARNEVQVFQAEASFYDPHTLLLKYTDGSERALSAEKIMVTVGTQATRDPHIPFDGRQVFTSDDILQLDCIPRTLAVVGAGIIGTEYASIFTALGVRVTLVDCRPRLLEFLDAEITDALAYHLRQDRATIWLGETVRSIEPFSDARGDGVKLHLESGKYIVAEKALYSIGRTGATARLNLPAAGLTPDDRGRLKVNDRFQTAVPHIYAAGDVIGFPSLAATSMEQGRLAASHAFGVATEAAPERFPIGIYSVPEISMVGGTEEDLTHKGVPYEVGKAQYQEIARGQILGDSTGLLKLIFHLETRKLLGVHIIGEGAAELIHIGQAVLSYDGKVDYFIENVFNYPTLAECYKTAAFDGINRLAL